MNSVVFLFYLELNQTLSVGVTMRLIGSYLLQRPCNFLEGKCFVNTKGGCDMNISFLVYTVHYIVINDFGRLSIIVSVQCYRKFR